MEGHKKKFFLIISFFLENITWVVSLLFYNLQVVFVARVQWDSKSTTRTSRARVAVPLGSIIPGLQMAGK